MTVRYTDHDPRTEEQEAADDAVRLHFERKRMADQEQRRLNEALKILDNPRVPLEETVDEKERFAAFNKKQKAKDKERKMWDQHSKDANRKRNRKESEESVDEGSLKGGDALRGYRIRLNRARSQGDTKEVQRIQKIIKDLEKGKQESVDERTSTSPSLVIGVLKAEAAVKVLKKNMGKVLTDVYGTGTVLNLVFK